MYYKIKGALKLLLILLLNIFFILLFLYVNDSSQSFSFGLGSSHEYVEVLSRRGSTGSEVRSIQEKLRALGYYKGNIDGIYGAQTEAAVKAFQKAKVEAAGINTMMMPEMTPCSERGRSEERRVGKECRSRWSPYH